MYHILMENLESIKEVECYKKIKEKGIAYCFRRLIEICISFIFQKRVTIIYEKDLVSNSKVHIKLQRKGKFILNVHTDLTTLENNSKLQIEQSSYLQTNEMKDRFVNGGICFLVKDEEEKLVHYAWACLGRRYIEFVDKNIRLNSSEAFIFNCYTFEEYRGLSIYPWTLVKIQEYFKRNDFKKIYIDALPRNVPSTKGIKKAGFIPYSKLILLIFLKFIKTFKQRNFM